MHESSYLGKLSMELPRQGEVGFKLKMYNRAFRTPVITFSPRQKTFQETVNDYSRRRKKMLEISDEEFYTQHYAGHRLIGGCPHYCKRISKSNIWVISEVGTRQIRLMLFDKTECMPYKFAGDFLGRVNAFCKDGEIGIKFDEIVIESRNSDNLYYFPSKVFKGLAVRRDSKTDEVVFERIIDKS